MLKTNNTQQVLLKGPDGVARAKKGGYAYMMESPTVDFNVENDKKCELMQIGGLLDSKGYGLGMKKGSPLTEPLSLAILDMKETDEYHAF